MARRHGHTALRNRVRVWDELAERLVAVARAYLVDKVPIRALEVPPVTDGQIHGAARVHPAYENTRMSGSRQKQ